MLKTAYEYLCGLYTSPTIKRMIRPRRIKLAGHVDRWHRRQMHTGLLNENFKAKDSLEGLGLRGGIIIYVSQELYCENVE
jgi:hypothetical protein